jgi:hypothetical protein
MQMDVEAIVVHSASEKKVFIVSTRSFSSSRILDGVMIYLRLILDEAATFNQIQMF